VRRLRIALLIAMLAPAGLAFGQDNKGKSDNKDKNTYSEKAGEVFQKLATLVKEQNPNWNAALDLLNGLIPTLGPDSYDMAQALQTKAKLLLQKEEYAKAIEPMEKALQLSDAKDYFDMGDQLLLVDLLARLYSQEAQSTKDPVVQQQDLAKAVVYFKRWMKDSPKPNADSSLFYAQILVQQATVNPNKTDMALLKEAHVQVDSVLKTTLKPKENAYFLLYFILQQEGDIEKSANVLELLVKLYPTKSNYWQQLMATYNTLAGSYDKDPDKQRKYYIRAINTIERAQPYGFLKDSRNQYNLITLYMIAGQFGRSTELLYSGLKSGLIENDVQNWFRLQYAYQQANQPLQAIAALREAAQRFPKNGQIDFNIGQIYYGELDDLKNANTAFRAAIAKDNLEKPYQAYIILAYTCLELNQLDDALDAVMKAKKQKDYTEGDKKLDQMEGAIRSSIEDRDAKKKDAEKKAAEAKGTTL
jgi:tetratricopeptide (TPR) repeat protein